MATQQRLTDVPEHMGCEDEEPGDMFAGPDPHSVAWALEEEERRNAELRARQEAEYLEKQQRIADREVLDLAHCEQRLPAGDLENPEHRANAQVRKIRSQVLCGHCGYYESIDGVRNCAKMHHRSASILDDLIATDRNPVETQEFKRLAALIRTPASLRTEPLGGMRNPLFTHEEAFIDWAARTSHGDNPR